MAFGDTQACWFVSKLKKKKNRISYRIIFAISTSLLTNIGLVFGVKIEGEGTSIQIIQVFSVIYFNVTYNIHRLT